MGVGKYLQGGTKGIPKPLGDNPYAPRRRHLRPLEAAPSALGGGTFTLRSLRLRKEEAASSLIISLILRSKPPIVVTLVTLLLPQVPVFQIVLQGGNGCKGKKIHVGDTPTTASQVTN